MSRPLCRAACLLLGLAIGLAACSAVRQPQAAGGASPSVPTIAPAFGGQASAMAGLAQTSQAPPALTQAANPIASTPAPTSRPREATRPEAYTIRAGSTVSDTITVTSYPLPDLSAAYGLPIRKVPLLAGGRLDPRWTLEHTWGMTPTVEVGGFSRTGEPVLRVEPYAEDYGRFFMAVRPETDRSYDYERHAGISFWISGGDSTLHNDEIAITVVGSNFVPYYRWDDRSVLPVRGLDAAFPTFSETLLVFLDVDQIPPNTWLEVVLWIDERQFDPVYTYITGIYVRSKESVPAFYLDGVSLLEIGE